ncbi:MAG TPA: hypothetical protein VHW23_13305 [Kofleriaceae bacterium]|nr:hypothetical protein [Kofleriaceae bacterium]
MLARRVLWLAVMWIWIACHHRGAPPIAGGIPAVERERPPTVIHAPERVVLTPVDSDTAVHWARPASGFDAWIPWHRGNVGVTPHASVVATVSDIPSEQQLGASVTLRIIDGHGAAVRVPLADVKPLFRVFQIGLDDRTARVAFADGPGLSVVVVDLAGRRASAPVRLRAATGPVRIYQLGRTADGWIAAGYRERDGQATAVAWVIADDATELPEPFPLANVEPDPEYGYLTAAYGAGSLAVDPDGSAIVALPVDHRPTSCDVVAIRHDQAWKVLRSPCVRALGAQPVRAGSSWVFEQLYPSLQPPAVYAIDVTGDTRKLDAAWAQAGRHHLTTVMSTGEYVVALGGGQLQPDALGRLFLSGPDRRDGAIYDLSSGTARTIAGPVLGEPGIEVVDPDLIATVGDQLCMFGGSTLSVPGKPSSRVEGAACLDGASASWRWLEAPRLPGHCRAVATDDRSTLLLCDDGSPVVSDQRLWRATLSSRP